MQDKEKIFMYYDNEMHSYIGYTLHFKENITEEDISDFYQKIYKMKLEFTPNSENVLKGEKNTENLIYEFGKIFNSNVINFKGLLDTYDISLLEIKMNMSEKQEQFSEKKPIGRNLSFCELTIKRHLHDFFAMFDISEPLQYTDDELTSVLDSTRASKQLSHQNWNGLLKNQIDSVKSNTKIMQLGIHKFDNSSNIKNKVYIK